MRSAARALLEDSPDAFADDYAKADATTARSVLKQLEASRSPYALLLRAWVTPVDVERLWPKAMKAMTVFTNPYTLRYKKKWLVQLAGDPELVEAVRIAAVSCHDVPDELIAVLAIDGSEASLDALMPSFSQATTAKDERLDVLESLKALRLNQPAVVAMLGAANASRAARMAESPALGCAESLGLPLTAGFHFSLAVHSVTAAGVSVPALQLHLTVDSRVRTWFSVSAFRVADNRQTTFDSAGVGVDELKLGAAPPAQWPQWLARAAKTLRTQWSPDVSVRSNLRGAKRAHLARWLTTPEPAVKARPPT